MLQKESQDLNSHFLQVEASRLIGTDGILIPNGPILNITNTLADFKFGKSLGEAVSQTSPGEFCGTGTKGVRSRDRFPWHVMKVALDLIIAGFMTIIKARSRFSASGIPTVASSKLILFYRYRPKRSTDHHHHFRIDVTTDQPALQVYTCNGIFNASLPIPRKQDQGGSPSAFYQDHSCLVVEQEGWIDGINQPEWKVDQIYGPDKDYHWNSQYQFSVIQ